MPSADRPPRLDSVSGQPHRDLSLFPLGIVAVTSEGHMNILARAKTPFRLLERREDLPYPAGVVEFLGDVEEEADESAARDARELYRELVEQATDERLQDEALSKMDAYRMAATV